MSMVNTNYGVGTENVYSRYYDAKKTEGVGFAQKAVTKAAVSTEDMTLDEYKAYFQDKMDALYTSPTQRNRNWVIDITDSAYERMKNDPEYEQRILDALAKNKAYNFGKYIPSFSYTHIDDTWEKCTAYTYGMEDNYQTSSKSSGGGLGEWWQERHERFEELLAEQVKAAQQREQWQRKLSQQEQEYDRMKSELGQSRKTQAFAAYESSIMTVPTAGGSFES